MRSIGAADGAIGLASHHGSILRSEKLQGTQLPNIDFSRIGRGLAGVQHQDASTLSKIRSIISSGRKEIQITENNGDNIGSAPQQNTSRFIFPSMN